MSSIDCGKSWVLLFVGLVKLVSSSIQFVLALSYGMYQVVLDNILISGVVVKF